MMNRPLMPEECGNFHNLRDAVIANPECISHSSDYPAVRVCNELCGDISGRCLEIIERQKNPQPVETNGDSTEELMRKACGSLEGFFNMAINPIFIRLKVKLAAYALRINKILGHGLSVDPALTKAYMQEASQAFEAFKAVVGSVNFPGEGNFLVRAFFRTLLHDFGNKFTVAFGRADLEVWKIQHHEKFHFNDFFSTLPLMTANEHDLSLVDTNIFGLVGHCVADFSSFIKGSPPPYVTSGAVFNITHQSSIQNGGLSRDLNANVHPKVMEEIVRELIRNSTKAMPNGGDITLTIRRDDKNIVIDVTDTGEGIPEENLEKIFDEKFTTREKTGGTGIGLFLALSYVEKILHGTITVDSEVGKGTTFSVVIPACEKESITASPQARQVAEIRQDA